MVTSCRQRKAFKDAWNRGFGWAGAVLQPSKVGQLRGHRSTAAFLFSHAPMKKRRREEDGGGGYMNDELIDEAREIGKMYPDFFARDPHLLFVIFVPFFPCLLPHTFLFI